MPWRQEYIDGLMARLTLEPGDSDRALLLAIADHVLGLEEEISRLNQRLLDFTRPDNER